RSSAWYCPGAPASGTAADASVVVANAGARRLTGTVTVFPGKGDSRKLPLDVGPASRAAVRLADAVSSPFAAAVVELDGGEAVAARLVARTGRLAVSRVQTFDGTGTTGRKGVAVSLGAAAPGPVWYFPEGLVTDGQSERYQIYNPGVDEAQVEVDLALETG